MFGMLLQGAVGEEDGGFHEKKMNSTCVLLKALFIHVLQGNTYNEV